MAAPEDTLLDFVFTHVFTAKRITCSPFFPAGREGLFLKCVVDLEEGGTRAIRDDELPIQITGGFITAHIKADRVEFIAVPGAFERTTYISCDRIKDREGLFCSDTIFTEAKALEIQAQARARPMKGRR